LGWADKFAGFVDLDMENQPESIAERCACGYLLRSVASGRCPECGRNVTVEDGPPLACYRERRLELRRDFALYPDRLMVLQRNWSGTGHWAPIGLNDLIEKTTTVWV